MSSNDSLLDYDYDLPEDQIALYPSKQRAQARLLQYSKHEKTLEHRKFFELEDILQPGDCLVLNNTKVMAARLLGEKQETGAKIEALLLDPLGGQEWEVLLCPSQRVKKDTKVIFQNGEKQIEMTALEGPREGTGARRVRFEPENFIDLLEDVGHMPLPPYIHRDDESIDRDEYQTCFAESLGSVAAPTAGLHFDGPLLERLKAKGIEVVEVTLHVGYGTFQPILAGNFKEHEMHTERFEVTQEAAEKILKAKQENRRVIACGTTSVRVLETLGNMEGGFAPGQGQTNIFIYPPFSFKIVDGLITNFHLPKSSLMLLVGAFLGSDEPAEELVGLYKRAIAEKYRFYSYGDAMVIL